MKNNLFEFALNSLLRRGSKNIFIAIIFTLLIFVLSSVFLITNSLKTELYSTLEALPEIIVQKIVAGKQKDIEVERSDQILQISGVEDAIPRIWGYYYFEHQGVNFSIIGIDSYENQYKENLAQIADRFDDKLNSENPSMIVGQGVYEILKHNYYEDFFYFVKPNGDSKEVSIGGVFKSSTNLESSDTIVMSKELVREIFELDESYATDIIVRVPNPKEISTIALKIKELYPDTRVITKEDIKVSYQNIFDYKSGIFLAFFVLAIFTFFIIIYDKASGLSSEEKKEIGILKAVGWKIDDILAVKFYEALIISATSFFLALTLSIFYVYLLEAPLLKDIFMGYSVLKPEFKLPFSLNVQVIALLFFITIPVYVAATIIPSWKAATLEADEVIR